MDISQLRIEYRERPLRRKDLLSDPVEQFYLWFEEALRVEEIEPNAMALATVDKEARPSCRTVLLKHVDEKGFVFFTNMSSRKAEQLKEQPWAAATLWWRQLERQVTLEGQVVEVSPDLAASYFAKRPRTSQLAAWASAQQSAFLPAREMLEKEFHRCEEIWKEQEVALPPFWGGFRIIPERIEFWQGRPNRLHDRFLYVLENGKWGIERLWP